MKHYGDITKISGYDVPIVDCIVGGSPCQDLSVAGKRAGLDGERSGLFMEQIRITKEMREKDARDGKPIELIRPRFLIWENVPGAFSSNKGQDFRIVLEEIAKVVDKDASIPMPPKDKWTTSGAIVGDGWSIAWRILDAQFWGVPQRRRRITLVADFGGGCAQEILFVKESLRRNPTESRTERQGASTDAQGCLGVHDSTGECYGFPLGFRPENVRLYDEKATTLCVGTRAGFCNGIVILEPGIASREGGHIYSGTLRANAGDNQMSVAYSINHQGGNVEQIIEDKTGTLTASMNSSGNNKLSVAYQPVKCYDIGDRRSVANESIDVSPTLLSKMGTGGNNVPVVVEGVDCYNQSLTGDKTMTLTNCATDPHHIPCVVMDRSAYNQGVNANIELGIDEDGVAFSHIAKGPGAVCYIDTSHADDVVRTDDVVAPRVMTKKPHYIVRRLTPLECERLQGFPDGWTDIGEYIDSKGKKKKTSDSARYKALGNSIALPPWKWVIKRISAQYERDATLASLFDGIGGFPLLWEQINGKGSCLWASEIEDFPIAVTKVRIE